MNSLWSIAAQAQLSCRCRLCLHSGRSILRQSSTAAPRRKITAADIFTACYTTILGTAAIIDADRKEARKKELDERLEKARAAVASLAIQESPAQQDGGTIQPDSDSANASQHIRGPGGKEKGATRLNSTLWRELGGLCEITRRPPPHSSWMQNQLEWVHVEAAIAAEERDLGDSKYTLREPNSDQKLERTTAMVVELVNRLLWRSSQAFDSVRSQDSAEESREEHTGTEDLAWRDLYDILQNPHYPSYHFPTADADDTAKTRSLLGESIRRIFNHAASSKEIVAKICYNILASSALPTTHTYNTLIAGFNRIQRPDLAQDVIDSYIHRSAWPATQQTMVCLLNHYRGTRQIEGLRDIVRRMRGVKDTGLNFRIIHKDAIHSEDWLNWARTSCASRKTAFVRRAYRGDEVFDSLVKAWLHCGEVGHACMVLVACLRKGSYITVQTLQELLTACLATFDYAAARCLLRGFIKNARKFAKWIDTIIHQESTGTSRQVVMCLSHLLDIGWLPPEHFHSPVAKKYDQMLRQLRSLFIKAQLHLEIQETSDICRVALKEINSAGRLIDRLGAAVASLGSAQWSRQQITKTLANFDRLAQVVLIDESCRSQETSIEAMTLVAKAAIIKFKTGYDLDPSSLLRHKPPETRYHRNRYDCIYNALQCIQIYEGPVTPESIRLQLLHNLPDRVLLEKLESSGNAENLLIEALVSLYTSNAKASTRPEDPVYSESVRQLELELTATKDTIRAILFAHLRVTYQRKLRFLYPNWYDMPLERIVGYHMRMRRLISKAPAVTYIQPIDVDESREQENPAPKPTEEVSVIVEDTYRHGANGIVPARRATKHAGVERELPLGLPVFNHSPGPFSFAGVRTKMTIQAATSVHTW
ncbi:hypothetical protein GGR54DRAFT_610351 [Hypoxylon sp. NC1633]|nr:hypothetical protein GGR54DRAFT_610351 [Hypoxylon sp. NC1633]